MNEVLGSISSPALEKWVGKVHSVWWNLGPGKSLLSKRWADTVSLLRGTVSQQQGRSLYTANRGLFLWDSTLCVLHVSYEEPPALHTQMDCRHCEFLVFLLPVEEMTTDGKDRVFLALG